MRKISISRILGLLSLYFIISIVMWGGGRKHLVYSSTNPSSELDADSIFERYAQKMYNEPNKVLIKYLVKEVNGNAITLESKDSITFTGKAIDIATGRQHGETLYRSQPYKVIINAEPYEVKKFKFGDELYLIPTNLINQYFKYTIHASLRLSDSESYSLRVDSHRFGEDKLKSDSNQNIYSTDFQVLTLLNSNRFGSVPSSSYTDNLKHGFYSLIGGNVEYTTVGREFYDQEHTTNESVPLFNVNGGRYLKSNYYLNATSYLDIAVKVTPNLWFKSSYVVIKAKSGINLKSTRFNLSINGNKLTSTFKSYKFNKNQPVQVKLHKHIVFEGVLEGGKLIKKNGWQHNTNAEIFIGLNVIQKDTDLSNFITNNYVFNPTKLQKNSTQSLQFNLN